jgi:chromosome segregation ATPase
LIPISIHTQKLTQTNTQTTYTLQTTTDKMPNGHRRQTNTAHANRQRNLQRAIEVQASQVHVAPVVVEAMEMAEVRSAEVKKLKGQIVGLKNKINNIEKQLKNREKKHQDEVKELNNRIEESKRFNHHLKEKLKEGVGHLETLEKMNEELKEALAHSDKQIALQKEIIDSYKRDEASNKTIIDGLTQWMKKARDEGYSQCFETDQFGTKMKLELRCSPVEEPKDLSRWVAAGGCYGDY